MYKTEHFLKNIDEISSAVDSSSQRLRSSRCLCELSRRLSETASYFVGRSAELSGCYGDTR